MKKKVVLLALIMAIFATCFLTGADSPCGGYKHDLEMDYNSELFNYVNKTGEKKLELTIKKNEKHTITFYDNYAAGDHNVHISVYSGSVDLKLKLGKKTYLNTTAKANSHYNYKVTPMDFQKTYPNIHSGSGTLQEVPEPKLTIEGNADARIMVSYQREMTQKSFTNKYTQSNWFTTSYAWIPEDVDGYFYQDKWAPLCRWFLTPADSAYLYNVLKNNKANITKFGDEGAFNRGVADFNDNLNNSLSTWDIDPGAEGIMDAGFGLLTSMITSAITAKNARDVINTITSNLKNNTSKYCVIAIYANQSNGNNAYVDYTSTFTTGWNTKYKNANGQYTLYGMPGVNGEFVKLNVKK